MKDVKRISEIQVCVRGGGDLGSGVAWRLHMCGFRVLITDIENPLAVRRRVAFCEAVYDGKAQIEGVEAVLCEENSSVYDEWDKRKIPLLIDPMCDVKNSVRCDVIVDAILAKRNTGTSINDAPLVIALGPGFYAGRDAHFVVETNRGHSLGRLLDKGQAEPDTGIPGPVSGVTSDRLLRAPADGKWENKNEIGDLVKNGDILGSVEGEPLRAMIDGVLRGLIRPGITVRKGMKIGDIDPRSRKEFCDTISEKALAIGGGVIEGILRAYSGTI